MWRGDRVITAEQIHGLQYQKFVLQKPELQEVSGEAVTIHTGWQSSAAAQR